MIIITSCRLGTGNSTNNSWKIDHRSNLLRVGIWKSGGKSKLLDINKRRASRRSLRYAILLSLYAGIANLRSISGQGLVRMRRTTRFFVNCTLPKSSHTQVIPSSRSIWPYRKLLSCRKFGTRSLKALKLGVIAALLTGKNQMTTLNG